MKEELKQFNIDLDSIKANNSLFDNIQEAIEKMKLYTLSDRFEVVLNNNLIESREKLTNFRTILGCRISYDNLDENISFIVKKDNKPSYEELEKRINKCIKYLYLIENHDFTADIPVSILNGNEDDLDEINKWMLLDVLKGNE